MDPQDEVLTVMRALCRYLSDNPQACDTLPGIGRWWLLEQHAPAVVDAALQRLHADGLLDRLPAADGRVRYRQRNTRQVRSGGQPS